MFDGAAASLPFSGFFSQAIWPLGNPQVKLIDRGPAEVSPAHTTGFHPKSIERYMGSRIGLHHRAIRLLTKFRSWDRLDQCFRKLTLAVFTTVKETKSRLCRHMPIPLSVMGLGRDRSFDKRDPISQSKRSPPKGVGGGGHWGRGGCLPGKCSEVLS
jgi:hypothetical protein